jgi:hypothetical protein
MEGFAGMEACVRFRFSLAVLFGLCSTLGAADHSSPLGPRTVVIASGLTETDFLLVSCAAKASEANAVLLADAPPLRRSLESFLKAYQPARVLWVGHTALATEPIRRTWNAQAISVDDGMSLAERLYPKAPKAVVAAPTPRPVLLQAAALAGTLRVPLLVAPASDCYPRIRRVLDRWGTKEVIMAGVPSNSLPHGGLRVEQLPDAESISRRRQEELREPRTLIVTNPTDGRMSFLAPLIAVNHNAPLLCTNERGDDAAQRVRETSTRPGCRHIDTVIFIGSPAAIPTIKRPNPEVGKDREIEMEPLTPVGKEPQSFAVGRLYHEEPATVLLMLARQGILEHLQSPRALIVSNSGSSLALLETFSRNTAGELQNRGLETQSRFGDEVNAEELRQLMTRQDLFIWEGHHLTMVRDYQMPLWDEPLAPSLVCLQSCLALNDGEAGILLRRGAVAVVGSSSRTYSGSGGAFTLALVDALLYEGQSLGGALRQAKNFLQAYALLKEKRLGSRARQAGANIRSAWAFTLWGDPTLRFPLPAHAPELAAIGHSTRGRTLTITLPELRHDRVTSGAYEARMPPNARLAGLMSMDEEEDRQKLVPLAFVEVAFKVAPSTPTVTSRLPQKDWIFLWDERRSAGYLLVRIGNREKPKLEFHFSRSLVDTASSLDATSSNP